MLLATAAFALPVELSLGFADEQVLRLSIDAPAEHGQMLLALPVGDRDLVWLDLAARVEPDGQVVFEPYLYTADPRRRLPERAVLARPRITAAPGQLAELSNDNFRIELRSGD